jgi:hypothetical protein
LACRKRFQQVQGVDYNETFSPVAMFKSIQILLVIVAFHHYEIWQMDVKTVFLNSNIDEELYMMQPKDFSILTMLIKCANFSVPFMG